MFHCSTTLTSLFQFIRSNDPYVPRFHGNKTFAVGFWNAFFNNAFPFIRFSSHCPSYASVVPDMFIPNTHNSRDTQIPGVRLFWRLISGGLQSVRCFVSLARRLEFGIASWISENLCTPPRRYMAALSVRHQHPLTTVNSLASFWLIQLMSRSDRAPPNTMAFKQAPLSEAPHCIHNCCAACMQTQLSMLIELQSVPSHLADTLAHLTPRQNLKWTCCIPDVLHSNCDVMLWLAKRVQVRGSNALRRVSQFLLAHPSWSMRVLLTILVCSTRGGGYNRFEPRPDTG